MGKPCTVCKRAQSNYKCPNCFVPYCSVPCYHKHKEEPCCKLGSSQDKETVVPAELQMPPRGRGFELKEDESGLRLRKSQLEAVAASHEIRELLMDSSLRKQILRIDSSLPEEQRDLGKSMQTGAFGELSAKILSILNSEDVSHVTETES